MEASSKIVKKKRSKSKSGPYLSPLDADINIHRLLEPPYLNQLARSNTVSIVDSTKRQADHASIDIFSGPLPPVKSEIGTTLDVPEDKRISMLLDLGEQICNKIVQTDTLAKDEANLNLKLGQVALQKVLSKIQKFRAVYVRKRQLGRVGDVRWSSVKHQLKKRAENECKKNLEKRPIEARIAVQMAVVIIKGAQDGGPSQVLAALQAVMGPLKNIITELPDILKKDKSYQTESTGLFDEVENFLFQVFQGEFGLPLESRSSVLSSVGSMLLQLGVSRESAPVLIRLCHTILCHSGKDGALTKLPLDTLGVQALMEMSQQRTKGDRFKIFESYRGNHLEKDGRRLVYEGIANDGRSAIFGVGGEVVSKGRYVWEVKLSHTDPRHHHTDPGHEMKYSQDAGPVWISGAIGVVAIGGGSEKTNLSELKQALKRTVTFSSKQGESMIVEVDMDAKRVVFRGSVNKKGFPHVQRLASGMMRVSLFVSLGKPGTQATIIPWKPKLGTLKVWGKLDTKAAVSRRGHVVHLADRKGGTGSGSGSGLRSMCKSMYKHGLGLDADGNVYGWGDASNSALGPRISKSVGIPEPLNLDFQGSVSSVGCGSAFSAAVTSDGKLYVWGNVNLMDKQPTSTPRLVTLPNAQGQGRALHVACGFNFTLVSIDHDGKSEALYSFGKNNKGQLGIGSTEASSELKEVLFPERKGGSKSRPGLSSRIVSFACGWFHALAADSTGRLYSWGGAVKGNKPVCGLGYGDGKDTPHLTPQLVKSVSEFEVVSVVCGHDHSLCLDASGRVWSWGSNDHGQLGNGDLGVDRPFPTLLTPKFLPAAVKSLAGGKAHSSAVTKDGALYCWGQLGQGCTVDDLNGKGDKKMSKPSVSVPKLLCSKGCYLTSCLSNGHVLALSHTPTFAAPGASAKRTMGWQESGLEPFRPDPALKNSSNIGFKEEGDDMETIRVTCRKGYPDRVVAFQPVLSSGCFEIEFNILQAFKRVVDIGVLDADKTNGSNANMWRTQSLEHIGYCLSSSGKVCAIGVPNHTHTDVPNYRAGDRLRMKLDMEKREMWVAKNGGEMLKCFDHLPERVTLALGIEMKNVVVVSPLSVGGGKVRFLRGSKLYSKLWLPPAVEKIKAISQENVETAGNALVTIMHCIAQLCGQQSYPDPTPSILGAPKLLTAPLCIHGKGPEMVEQLVDMACTLSQYFSKHSKQSKPLPPPLDDKDTTAFLLLTILRVIRANLHRILISGVDQRWVKISTPNRPKRLHPWRKVDVGDTKEGCVSNNQHVLRRLHHVLVGVIEGDYIFPKQGLLPLTKEAAGVMALAIELFYPTTQDRLELVGFLLESKNKTHPLCKALKHHVIEGFCKEAFTTSLIPEPIKIPRRLRMSTENEGHMLPDEEKAVQDDKDRFQVETKMLVDLLLTVNKISIQQGLEKIKTYEGGASTQKSAQELYPGKYVVRLDLEIRVEESIDVGSRQVGKLRPLSEIQVETVHVMPNSGVVRGYISNPQEGWVSLRDAEATVYRNGCLLSEEMKLFHALNRHTLAWAASYNQLVAHMDTLDLPEGGPDINVQVSMESGEVIIVKMNRKDRVASLKERVSDYLPKTQALGASGVWPGCRVPFGRVGGVGGSGTSTESDTAGNSFVHQPMEIYFNGENLNDEDTLERCGISNKAKLIHKAVNRPLLRRTLSAFKPRSKDQAKASHFGAMVVESALRKYSNAVLDGCSSLCNAIKKQKEKLGSLESKSKMNRDAKVPISEALTGGSMPRKDMGLCRSMSVLKSFLGAVGGPLILTALSSSDAVKAVPNTLKLSQDKVEMLMSEIKPLLSIPVPMLPTSLSEAHQSQIHSAVRFDRKGSNPTLVFSKNDMTVEKKNSSDEWSSALLNHSMPLHSGKYAFDFFINEASTTIFIGCANETFNMWNLTNENYYLGSSTGSWGFCGIDWTTLQGSNNVGRHGGAYSKSSVGGPFRKGDVISILVDTDKHTISYERNGKELGVAFKDFKYQKLVVGVTLVCGGDKVTFAPRDTQLPSREHGFTSFHTNSTPSNNPLGPSILWKTPQWLPHLQVGLGICLSEGMVQMLIGLPLNVKDRVQALKKLHTMLKDNARGQKENEKAAFDLWLSGLDKDEVKYLEKAISWSGRAMTISGVESLGMEQLSVSLFGKIHKLRSMGRTSSCMLDGSLRCLLKSLEAGLLNGVQGNSKELMEKQIVSIMSSVTSILSDKSVRYRERLLALKVWASVLGSYYGPGSGSGPEFSSSMGGGIVSLQDVLDSGLLGILHEEMQGSLLPCAKIPLEGKYIYQVERVKFERAVFEVFRMWVSMAARMDDKFLRKTGIVDFVVSELMRLAPNIVADGKRILQLLEKRRASVKNAYDAKDQVKYAEKLNQLSYMGFVDMAQNMQALRASAGNVQSAVERLLSGKPISVAAFTRISPPVPKAVVPWMKTKASQVFYGKHKGFKKESVSAVGNSSDSGEGGNKSLLSIWIDITKLRFPARKSEMLIAYRGIEKKTYCNQPTHNSHRWQPRISIMKGFGGNFRFSALVTCRRSRPRQQFVYTRDYDLNGAGWLHVSVRVESKTVSLYVNGIRDNFCRVPYSVSSLPSSLPVVWGPGIQGYEDSWNGKMMWIDKGTLIAYNDQYSSMLLRLLNWLPPSQLVNGAWRNRPKRPTNLKDLLEGAGLVKYEDDFEQTGYDDFEFVISLTPSERVEFYETVKMHKQDQKRYEDYLQSLTPPPSTLSYFLGMLLAGSPKAQLVIVRLLRRLLRHIPPAAFDDIMDTEAKGEFSFLAKTSGSKKPPVGFRFIRVLGTMISKVLWAPYDTTIIPQHKLKASIPVAKEVIRLLRHLIAEFQAGRHVVITPETEADTKSDAKARAEVQTNTDAKPDTKSKNLPPIHQWGLAVRAYLDEGIENLKELIERLRPLGGNSGFGIAASEWDESVIYADSLRISLETLYVLCGSTVLASESMGLQAALTDYHYYYYCLSPYGSKISRKLAGIAPLGSSDSNPSPWSLPNELAKMLDYVKRLTAMYGTLGQDGNPPYSAIEFDLVRLWLITGIPPRGIERKKKYKAAFNDFKKYQQDRMKANFSSSTAGNFWAAGTGYGHGNSPEDSSRVRRMKLNHEERVRKETAEVVGIMSSVLRQLESKTLTHTFVQALSDSSVVPWLKEILKNTSTLDIEKSIRKYHIALDVTEAIARREETVFLFLPPAEPEGSAKEARVVSQKPSLKDVLLEQKQNAHMLLKFTKEKTESSLKTLFNKILRVYKMVAAAVRKHDAKRGEKKTQMLEHKKLIASCAHKSKVYGWVDEKAYVYLLKPRLFGEMLDFKLHHFKKRAGSGAGVGAAWTNRLGAELVGLSKSLPLNPNSSVFFRCNAKNMAYAKMIIAAPPTTPYGYGLFLFDVYFPPQYPNVAPKVNLMTTGRGSVRFNPNLYNCGKVCLSLLGTWSGSPEEMWQPNQSTFLQVCVSIQSLIFIEHPYFNEPGYESSINTPQGKMSSRSYNASREIATVQWAMLDILKNPPPGFEEVVRTHFFLQQKNICEQIENWLKLPEHKNGQLRQYYHQLKEELAKLKEPEVSVEDEDEDEESEDDDF